MTGRGESEDGPGKQAEAPSQVQGMVGGKREARNIRQRDQHWGNRKRQDERGRDARQTR